MWLSIFLLAFLIAVAYFQAIQGVTSAAIMAAATVVSLAISFCTYEFTAESFLMGIKPDFAHAVAFLGMFVVPLSVLRLLLDMWIPRSNLLPHLLDRAGGAVLGLFSSFLLTGMLAIGIQMVPWGGGFLGFTRFEDGNLDEPNELWLKPDRIAASFAAALSDGVFSGARSFRGDHPDFLSELGYLQIAPRGVRRAVPADSVTVVDAGRVDYVFELIGGGPDKPPEQIVPLDPKAGHIFTRVTLQLSGDQADVDGEKRFAPATVRLVGDEGGDPVSYPAIAVADPDDPNRCVRTFGPPGGSGKRIVGGLVFPVSPNDQVDVAFEVPERFDPRFVAYKFGGRAAITKARISGSSALPRARPKSTVTDQPPGAGQTALGQPAGEAKPPGGRISGVRFRSSHFGAELPLTLTNYQSSEAQVRSGILEQGHVHGPLEAQGEGGTANAVKALHVPPGKGLLHLNVESLRAGSMYGKAINWSVQTLENYVLDDDQGNRLLPVGKYAIASVGGEAYVEVQYFPDYVESGGRLRPFTVIMNSHLKGEYQLVYLFLLDQGARAVSFSTGSIKQPMDLRDQNLVAP